MGLVTTIQSAVNSLFTALDDTVGEYRLRRASSSSYDPSIGEVITPPIEYTFTGAMTNVDDTAFSGTTLVEIGDRVAYMKEMGIEPQIGDMVVGLDSVEYTIVAKSDISAYGTTFVWQLLVRE